jgi:hypothetical protein
VSAPAVYTVMDSQHFALDVPILVLIIEDATASNRGARRHRRSSFLSSVPTVLQLSPSDGHEVAFFLERLFCLWPVFNDCLIRWLNLILKG